MRLGCWGSALLLGGVGVVGASTPARSECLTVTVELHWWGNSPDTYPLGERDKCVTGTPFAAQPIFWGKDLDGGEPVLQGTPQGAFVQVWVPAP